MGRVESAEVTSSSVTSGARGRCGPSVAGIVAQARPRDRQWRRLVPVRIRPNEANGSRSGPYGLASRFPFGHESNSNG